MDSVRSRSVVRFGLFEVDLHCGEIRKSGIRIRLQDQPFQVLQVLLQRPGELVTREELRHAVWPENTFVEFDHALNTAIKKIRISLSDDPTTPRYVETIPKRGYRWIAPLQNPVPQTEVSNPQETSPAIAVETPGPAADPPTPAPGFRLPGRRWTALVALSGVLVFAGFVGFRLTRDPHNSRVVVAVLPFDNWSEDTGQARICRGLTEDLITQLAGLQPDHLRLVPDAAVLQYEHASRPVVEIGQELGADFVLQGNVRSSPQRLRVSAELIRVRDRVRLWGEIFDHVPSDPVQTEVDLAHHVAADLKPVLLSAAP